MVVFLQLFNYLTIKITSLFLHLKKDLYNNEKHTFCNSYNIVNLCLQLRSQKNNKKEALNKMLYDNTKNCQLWSQIRICRKTLVDPHSTKMTCVLASYSLVISWLLNPNLNFFICLLHWLCQYFTQIIYYSNIKSCNIL